MPDLRNVHMRNGRNYSGYNFMVGFPGISELSSISDISDSDLIIVYDGSSYKKATAEQLRDYAGGLKKVVFTGVSNLSLSSCRFPTTGTNPKIRSTMEVTEAYFSNPAAITSDITVDFYDGYLTVSGTMSGTSDIVLKIQDCETLVDNE